MFAKITTLLFILFFLVNGIQSYGQDTTSTQSSVETTKVDTNQTLSTKEQKTPRTFGKIFKGKPGRALIYSFILPGAGQVYNRKYWKLPLVYGALGGIGYSIYFNRDQYKRFDVAFWMRVELGNYSKDDFQNILPLQGINSYRKFYDKNLQRSYLGLGLVYLLIGVDAFVDRHLLEFDINENLSLHLYPEFQKQSSQIKCMIAFK